MKKNLKRFSVLLLTLSLLFALCGCDALDEMRQRQAFVNEDGTITWQGNIYKELPYSEFLNPDTSYENRVYATKPDVPVLLADMNHERSFEATEDKKVLSGYYGGEEYCYCLESIYDELCARINAPFEPEVVCYDYSVYNEETNEMDMKYYTLTQEQVDAIRLIVETEEPTVLADGMYMDTMNHIWLDECSADRLFSRRTMQISLSASGNTYYLTLYTDDGEVLFTVPSGCNDIFGDIYKAYNEANFIFDGFPADFEI